MPTKRIIFEQTDNDSSSENFAKQMELRSQLVYRHLKQTGQGFFSAISFTGPVIIIATIIFLYLLLR